MTTASSADPHDLKAVKSRLDQIIEAVSDESIPLDDALSFYEEAVKLGMKATEIMEADLLGRDDEADAASDQGAPSKTDAPKEA